MKAAWTGSEKGTYTQKQWHKSTSAVKFLSEGLVACKVYQLTHVARIREQREKSDPGVLCCCSSEWVKVGRDASWRVELLRDDHCDRQLRMKGGGRSPQETAEGDT